MRTKASLIFTLLFFAATVSLTVYGHGDLVVEQEGTSAAQTLQALVDLRFTSTAAAVATIDAGQTATRESELTRTADAALELTADALFQQALTGTASAYTATPSPSPTRTPTATRTPTVTRTPSPSPTASAIPDDLETRLANAYANMLKGRIGAAIVAFERQAADAPDWAEVHRAHAHALLAGFRFADAEAALLEAIDLGADDASIYARLGDARFERRDYAAAVEAYEQALERNPYNVDTLIRLGDAAIEAVDFKYSRQAFLRAIMIEPDNLSAVTGLAYILLDAPAARFDEAALFGGIALALGYQADGLHYTALNYYDLALEAHDFAPTPSGSAAVARPVEYQMQDDRLPVEIAYVNRAVLYYLYLMDSGAALDDVEAALASNPDFAPAYIVKAQILNARGDNVGARRALATARELAPDNPHVQRDYLAERQFVLFDAAPDDFYGYIRTQRDHVLTWPLNPSGAQLLPFVSPDWAYTVAIPGTRGQQWRIRVDDAYENGVDPIITLMGPDGRPVAGDDDSGEGRNAQLTYYVPGEGVYTLIVALIDTENDGALQLSIEERQPDGRFTLLETLTPTISPTPSLTRTPSPTPTLPATPTATPTAAPDADVTAEVLETLDEGYRLLIDGSTRSALSRFDQVVVAAPTWSQGYLAQARAYYALYEWRDMERVLGLAIEYGAGRDPFRYAHRLRAHARFELRMFDASIDDATFALEAVPRHRFTLALRGRAYHELKDYEAAEADLRAAVAFDPTVHAPMNSLYLTLTGLGWFLDDLLMVQSLSYALRWSNNGNDELAYESYTSALEYADTYSSPAEWVYVARALTNIENDLPEAALDDAERAVAAAPEYAVGYLMRARAWAALDDFEAARRDLDHAYSLDSTHGEIVTRRLRVYGALGERLPLAEIDQWFAVGAFHHVEWSLEPDGVTRLPALEQWHYTMPFEAAAGQTLNVAAEPVDPDDIMRLLIRVTAPDGTTLDYAYMNDGDIGAAALEGLALPVTGVYTLSVANTHSLGQADVRFALMD